MNNDDLSKLSKQIDAAQRTLHQIRAKAGCNIKPVLILQGTSRNEIAYTTAKRILEERRTRIKHWPDRDIFGEPAWDILLDLYVRQFEKDVVSVKSASIGSGAPATTALRWLKLLESKNLICSSVDPRDQRRRIVRLTPKGSESMTLYLEQIAR